MTRKKIEYLKYKCCKCGRNFLFEEMSEVPEYLQNGSVKTTYLCKDCASKKDQKIEELIVGP